jgi:pimeloyl-ACP methyl ester carboxylesterase
MQDGVVILHGIFRTQCSMRGLADFLKREGYAVFNLGYASTRFPLETLAEHIHPRIDAFAATVSGRVHFIGYSMGGLLIRAYLHRHRPQHLGHVVMAGTPNGGSEVADRMKDWRLYRVLYGPAGQQLITDQGGFASAFGAVDYPLGIIAGNRTLDPISSRWIGKPNDGKVSIDSTRLAGMTDHIIIAATHTLFPGNRTMWRLALEFLRSGKF